ncbi:MAG: hypothetical protein LC776_16865 [Acidobacteria bacterium]|nr:hypothetical protein [Acidobacteriota bacterium]
MLTLRTLLEEERQVLGRAAPNTLHTWCKLAKVLVASGRLEDASKELRLLLDEASGVISEDNVYVTEP